MLNRTPKRTMKGEKKVPMKLGVERVWLCGSVHDWYSAAVAGAQERPNAARMPHAIIAALELSDERECDVFREACHPFSVCPDGVPSFSFVSAGISSRRSLSSGGMACRTFSLRCKW